MTSTVVLGLTGALLTLVVLFEMLRRRMLREKHAVIWVLVAVGTLVVAAFPRLLEVSADLVGVQVPSNLLFFAASLLLLMLSLQHAFEIGRLEERTRTLAEEVALLHLRVDAMRTDLAQLPEGTQGHPEEDPGTTVS